MLVTFDSKVGRLTMFGDVAIQLIKAMGHSGTVPSAILARDVPEALRNLEQALATGTIPPPPPKEESGRKNDALDDEREPPVSIRQRAFPLLELLRAAAKKDADVMWKYEGQ